TYRNSQMTNPYRVGIELAMSSNHETVLKALSGSLLGVGRVVDDLHGKFSRLGTAIGGALSVFAGVELAKGLVDLAKASGDVSHEWTKIHGIMGETFDLYHDRIEKMALDTTKMVPGTTRIDALKAYEQSYSIVGPENAIAANESLVRTQSVLGNVL